MKHSKPTDKEKARMQDASDWLEDATGVKTQVGIETYKDGKLISATRLDNA